MQLRASINREIRSFLTARGYLEVQTPVLAPHLIPESHLEVFATEQIAPDGTSQPRYLVPSPEVWHKQLLGSGYGSVFEIARCFRNGEQRGAHHRNEFTMLEYYTVDADHLDSIAVTEGLLAHLLGRLRRELQDYGQSAERLQKLQPPFARISVREAVLRYSGIDLDRHRQSSELARAAMRIGIRAAAGDSWERVFNHILVDRVEPRLPDERPLLLIDYPAQVRTLAEPADNPRYSRRWELYAGGVELANCYAEERSAQRVRRFFAAEAEAKRGCRVPHRVDSSYSRWFGSQFPRCSGVALGVDRLVMLLSGETNMSRVILFAESDTIV